MDHRVTAIIPTVGRADMLTLCLSTLLRQSVPIDEVFVVHCGDDAETKRVAEDPSWTAGGLIVRYVAYPERNAAAQRNFAAEAASYDLLLFLDDDVELEPDFAEQLLTPIRNDPRVGATMGRAVNHPLHQPTPLWRLYRRIVAGQEGFEPGRLIGAAVPNGFPAGASAPIAAEWLASGICLVTRLAFRSVGGFAPYFTGSSPGEDMDLGYRLSRHWQIFFVPAARCIHHEAPQGRSRPESYHFWWVRGRFATVRRAFDRSRPVALAHVGAWAFTQTLSEALALRKGWRRGLLAAWRGRLRGLWSCLAWDPPCPQDQPALFPAGNA
jgi:GT2 family glycosyltransferase